MAVSRFNPSDPDTGFRLMMPTSVSVGSGSATVSGNGGIEFSGASSLSLNNVFTSDYRNYRINLGINAIGTSGVVNFRLRASGTDNSSNNYYWRGNEAASNGTSISGFNPGGVTNLFRLFYGQNTHSVSYSADLFGPQVNGAQTSYYGTNARWDGGNHFWETVSGTMSVTTSYDGITFIFAGAETGSISIYGYRK